MSISQNKHPKKEKICQLCQEEFLGTTRAKFCEPCRKARHKKQNADWAKNNRDRMNELQKRYRQDNLEKCREMTRSYMIRKYHEDTVWRNIKLQRDCQYRLDNKQELSRQKQMYHIRNRDRNNERARLWREENPEKICANNLKLRTRDPIAPELIKFVFAEYEYSCMYCDSKSNLSLEHILPVSRDGDNGFENLGVACKSCNSSKGSKTVIEFMEWRELF